MEDENVQSLDPSSWILSYVDFMTVIMAFFIVFVMIATKVESATELFIIKNIKSLETAIKKTLKHEGVIIENTGYNGIRIVIPSEINDMPMFKSGSFKIRDGFKPFLADLGVIILDSTQYISSYIANKDKFKNAYTDPKDLKLTIRIEGHTDTDGNDKSNMLLSLKRAEDVKNYFVENYVSSSGKRFEDNQFAICGYGETRPLFNIKNKKENRRVEIFFNYTMDDIAVLYGCMNPGAANFNVRANRDDGTCIGITNI